MSTRAGVSRAALRSKPLASRQFAPLSTPIGALADLADGKRSFASRGFEGFGGFGGFPGGGFPGGGGFQPPRSDNEKFYKVLGISREAAPEEIKKAYRKEAMKHHPDKGGDEVIFKDVSRAYEVLSDPQKRQIYDAHGEAGLENMEQGAGGGGQPGMNPYDLFSQFFGFNVGGQPRGKPRTPDSTYELQVGLDELYSGTSREIVFNRDTICPTCHGIGGSQRDRCTHCDGTGETVQYQQMGPFVQQIRGVCKHCGGKGHVVPPAKRCQTCKGRGVVKEKKTFSVDVTKGMEDGHQFRFRQQADEAPDHDTGDVVIILREKRHKNFARIRESLIMQKKITLSQALCGFELVVPFLDGKDLTLRSQPNEVFRPGDVVLVEGKGMPLGGPRGERFGNLHVKLDVEFPKSLPAEVQEKLLEVLGTREMSEEAPGDCTARRLEPQQVKQLTRQWQEEELRQQQAKQRSSEEGCTQM